jgi:hypothetical protein
MSYITVTFNGKNGVRIGEELASHIDYFKAAKSFEEKNRGEGNNGEGKREYNIPFDVSENSAKSFFQWVQSVRNFNEELASENYGITELSRVYSVLFNKKDVSIRSVVKHVSELFKLKLDFEVDYESDKEYCLYNFLYYAIIIYASEISNSVRYYGKGEYYAYYDSIYEYGYFENVEAAQNEFIELVKKFTFPQLLSYDSDYVMATEFGIGKTEKIRNYGFEAYSTRYINIRREMEKKLKGILPRKITITRNFSVDLTGLKLADYLGEPFFYEHATLTNLDKVDYVDIKDLSEDVILSIIGRILESKKATTWWSDSLKDFLSSDVGKNVWADNKEYILSYYKVPQDKVKIIMKKEGVAEVVRYISFLKK